MERLQDNQDASNIVISAGEARIDMVTVLTNQMLQKKGYKSERARYRF